MRRTEKARRTEGNAAPAPEWGERAVGLLTARGGRWALLFVLIATVRIVAVYPIYNHTIDEPAHIACGMEWLSKGQYKYEPQHPPLTRVMAALLPYLDGARTVGRDGIYNEGAAILYTGGQYDRRLTLARVGILPFFWLACGCLFVWVRQEFGSAAAALAVLLFSTTPPVLAHAGLATTDMGLTAGFAALLAALGLWLCSPGWKEAAALGAAVALSVAAKLSSVAFIPAVVLAFIVLAWRRLSPWGPKLKTLPIAVVAMLLAVWALYRFSFGPTWLGIPLPAPEWFAGIEQVRAHQSEGHPSYLLGSLSRTGFWLFYPVALGVKTPLALLALGLWGLWSLRRREEKAAKLALAVVTGFLIVGVASNINIGVRHVLPMYLALSLAGAVASVEVLKNKAWLAGGLLALHLGAGFMAHPDYLPYTNLLAGGEPEKVLADSDLDWGQDMKRLGARLKELDAPSVAFAPFISAHLEKVHGFPRISYSHPQLPSPGWNAVSITVWKVARMGLNFEHPEVQLWPGTVKPTERVGKGTLLYYFPPESIRQLPPEP